MVVFTISIGSYEDAAGNNTIGDCFFDCLFKLNHFCCAKVALVVGDLDRRAVHTYVSLGIHLLY